MKLFKAIFFIFCVSLSVSYAQSGNKIIIYPDSIIKHISPLLTGACIEDVNHEIYGGIYSQMIFGESFQELPMQVSESVNPEFVRVSGFLSCKAPRTELGDESEVRSWWPVKKGTAVGAFRLDTIQPFVGKQSQVIDFSGGKGAIGIENGGLNREGLSLVGQHIYEGCIYAKAGTLPPLRVSTPHGNFTISRSNVSSRPIKLHLSLESEDGRTIYNETTITVANRNWTKYNFKLVPNASASHARLSITLQQPGEITLGYVFLQPGNWGRYKNLPLRKDVVDALLKEKLTIMRYGGSMTLDSNYRWKNMIGPREKRPSYGNVWYPFASNGWGIIDFMNMCEAMGIVGVPDFNSNEKPSDMADFIEYENGSANTTWGKKRVADGHTAPYHLKYMELGNEQFHNKELSAKFKLLSDAIWSKDPSVQIVYCISDDTREDIAGDLQWLKQTIDNCREHGHQAWFDVHIANDNEREPNLNDLEFAEKQLSSIAPDGNFRLCIFEENAGNARIRRGLAHANAINRVERLPYDIPMMCAANCLQVDHQNDNGWDQGLLFFNQKSVWGQPSYYVSKMAANNYLPQIIKSTLATKTDTLDVTALRSIDGKTVALQVVNYKATEVTADIILDNYKGTIKTISAIQLKGNAINDWNTADEPYKIVPVKYEGVANNNSTTYTFAPYSFTIIRFEQ